MLKQDPELILKSPSHPGPLAELDFWASKASNLNAIYNQLQSDRVRRVLRFLDRAKSTYNAPFAKLCTEVFRARAEANDNNRFLKPLRPWLEELENMSSFEGLTTCFRPIIHLILLVWKGSAYYNTPSRLVVLLREICNCLIRQACGYVNGTLIFEMIEADEARKAEDMLRTLLRVFGAFKSTYWDYKAKALTEVPESRPAGGDEKSSNLGGKAERAMSALAVGTVLVGG